MLDDYDNLMDHFWVIAYDSQSSVLLYVSEVRSHWVLILWEASLFAFSP